MIAVTVELRELKEKSPAVADRVDVRLGDEVLISTENGLEVGKVVETEKIAGNNIDNKIIRKLNKNDYQVLKDNRIAAKKIVPQIREEINKENLGMSLTHVAYIYDRQKLFIYYTADSRVDFRKLIRVLGGRLKTRIQMVQIGVRDEMSIAGGVGICGREVCCHQFLKNIETVNIDMARNQCLSINPETIAGNCGRLLCCLRYENCYYEEVKKDFPRIGKKISTPAGKGEVIDVNYLKGTVCVKIKTGLVNEYRLPELRAGVKDKLKKWIK
ncbi:MAG: hypothetical protein JXJ19_03820 [Elusimicrobia bacterium]|nr:hypothetical protein [Elusimicrobiota bacterium]